MTRWRLKFFFFAHRRLSEVTRGCKERWASATERATGASNERDHNAPISGVIIKSD
jgi:hypothetical protein